MRHRNARTTVLVGLLAVLVPVFAGCGPAPWDLPNSDAPTPSQSTSDVSPPAQNDLSGGSTQRDLTAGPVAATISYWSTLRMDRWTPSAVKPISLSMETHVTPDNGQKVYLQRATMTAVPANATRTFDPLDPQVDQSTVAPGYLVLAPYSYSNSFNIGTLPEDATSVTVQFVYDFLVQTTPTSTEYAKQTATDTLTIAISRP